jgi:trimeric autotransporter adhesin
MQTWAEDGAQTALITGGLLMLGTGIASAHEDVNPDKQASLLDSSLRTPFTIGGISSGTPLGQSVGNAVGLDYTRPVRIVGNAEFTSTQRQNAAAIGDVDTGGTLAGGPAPHGAPPVQVTGNAVSDIGSAEAMSEVTTMGTSGGSVFTAGDDGQGSGNGDPAMLVGNVAQAAVAGPGVVNCTAAVATADASGENTSQVAAGGAAYTFNDMSTGAGEMVSTQLSGPVVSPTAGFGNVVGGLGTATSHSCEMTTSTSSGDGSSMDVGGLLTDDLAVAGGGTRVSGTAGTMACGDVATGGKSGIAAANVATGHTMPIGPSFGAAGAGLSGGNDGTGADQTTVTSSGVLTNGDNGTISGKLPDVPTAVIPKVVDDAVSAVGNAPTGTVGSHGTGTANGRSATSNGGTPSKPEGIVAARPNLTIFDVPAEIIADAMAGATKVRNVTVDESEAMGHLAVNGDTMGGLPATSLPKLPALTKASGTASPMHRLEELGPVSNLIGELFGVLGRALPAGQPTGGLPVNDLTGRRSVGEQSVAGSLTCTGIGEALLALAGKNASGSSPSGHLPAPRIAAAATRVAGAPVIPTPTLAAQPVHTSVQIGMDTSTVLNPGQVTEDASLAETQALLNGLFTHRLIASR